MNEKVKKVIFYFLLLQPFLDLYWFYHGQLADLFPFTLPTIIRILAVGIILVMFFSQKQNWQKLGHDKWLIAYLILLIVYSLLHLWHVRTFNSLSPNSYNYSSSSEIFYLIRMAMPLLLIYFTKEVNFTAVMFKHVIQGLSGLFSITIVLSNLLVISLRSYGDGRISANIFAWFFKQNIGYSHLASKGFFNFSNMIAATLFMLLPLMIYYLFSAYSKSTLTLLVFQALAMLELGTKVAAIGLTFGLIIGILLYLLHVYWFKNTSKNPKALLAIIIIEICSVAIIPFSPTIQRYNYEIQLAQQSDHDLTHEKEILEEGLKKYPTGSKRKAFLKDYIGKYYQEYALNKRFVLKSYPYQRDPEFWLTIMKENGEMRMQNRHLETAMLDRVVAYNNNRLDQFFGISYTRQNQIFNLERDFKSQIYSLGLVGMLLFVGPYVLVLLYGIYCWLRFKQQRSYLISSCLVSITFMLLSAYSSGNVLDFLTASLILAFSQGFLLSQLHKNRS